MRLLIPITTILLLFGCTSTEKEINIDKIQWEAQSSGTTVSFRGVSTVSKNVAWISGSRGTVLRTTDGGENWQNRSVEGASNLDFRDIHGIDEASAIIMSAGQPARFYKTTDGGETWAMKYDNRRPGAFFDSMDFWDELNGIAFSDPVDGEFLLMRTTDGGMTWNLVDTSNPNGFRSGMDFLSIPGSNCYVAVGLSGSDYTSDGGRTWMQADTVGYHAISIAKGSTVGWTVGSEGRIAKCTVMIGDGEQ